MSTMPAPSDAAIDPIVDLTTRRPARPIYTLRDKDQPGFSAAKWHLPPLRSMSGCLQDHILLYHLHGPVTASKALDGKRVRRHSHQGAVTFLPSREPAFYTIENSSTWLELYLAPAVFDRFAEEHVRGGRCPTISSVFAIQDPWLAGYFQMVAAEVEAFGQPAGTADSLFLAQARELVLRHLLRRYAGFTPSDPQSFEPPKGRQALRPALLRRVVDHMRARLGEEIYLRDLAALAHLSEVHFIRAFHAATGSTPYQFLTEERLRAGAELLDRNDDLSVAQIAQAAGFKSASHFATKFRMHYGATPSEYRRVRAE